MPVPRMWSTAAQSASDINKGDVYPLENGWQGVGWLLLSTKSKARIQNTAKQEHLGLRASCSGRVTDLTYSWKPSPPVRALGRASIGKQTNKQTNVALFSFFKQKLRCHLKKSSQFLTHANHAIYSWEAGGVIKRLVS